MELGCLSQDSQNGVKTQYLLFRDSPSSLGNPKLQILVAFNLVKEHWYKVCSLGLEIYYWDSTVYLDATFEITVMCAKLTVYHQT